MSLRIVPIFQRAARAYINTNHRHHKAPRGAIFCLAVNDGDKLVGVAMVGRPVSRNLQDGFTAEVTRLCTDGTRNACSILYAACWRAARELGYNKLITYILEEESGVSVRAAGWRLVGAAGGGKWSRKSRVRQDEHPTQGKLKFEVTR